MLRNAPNANILILAVILSTASAASGQTALERRFEEDSFRRLPFAKAAEALFINPATVNAQGLTPFQKGGKWSLDITTGVSLDSNAFTSRDNTEVAWRWGYGAELGYQWWVSEESGIVITPSVAIGGDRYDEFSELDGDSLSAGLAITFKKIPFNPTLSYGGLWGFDRGFSTENYTENTVALTIGDKKPLRTGGDFVPEFVWSIKGGYQFIDPSVLDRSFVAGTIGLEVPLTKKLSLSTQASLAYRAYTDFAPDDRDTWIFSASANLQYTLHEAPEGSRWGSLYLTGGVAYVHSDDSISTKDFDQVLTTVGLKWSPNIDGFLGLPMKSDYGRAKASGYKK